MENINKKVTVYLQGGMGMSIIKVEGKLKDLGTREYAQYKNAAYVDIVPKGKRKLKRYMQTSYPYMLVLEGMGHPDLDDGFDIVENSNPMDTVLMKRSRYLAFDDRWKEDADVEIDSYIARSNPVVLADFRCTKGFSSYTGKIEYHES